MGMAVGRERRVGRKLDYERLERDGFARESEIQEMRASCRRFWMIPL